MSNFKVGDWVRVRASINRCSYVCKIINISKSWNPCEKQYNGPLCINGSSIQLNDVEHWQPKVGEWCWFRSDNMPKYIQVLAQFKEYYNGEYTVFFNPKDVEEGTETIYYTECEPFIGELPSFTKEQEITTREMIAVMQAYENGAEIECNYKNNDKWFKVYTPIWDWSRYNYRVKQPPKKKLWYWEYCANGIWSIYSIRMTESQAKVKFEKTCGYKKKN